VELTSSLQTEDTTSKVRPRPPCAMWTQSILGEADRLGKMETAVLDLERKRIARDNEKAAAKAMESMNVSVPSGSSKSEDVALIVRPCRRTWVQRNVY
jgi:hypothetical protein